VGVYRYYFSCIISRNAGEFYKDLEGVVTTAVGCQLAADRLSDGSCALCSFCMTSSCQPFTRLLFAELLPVKEGYVIHVCLGT
jgi:hypothetical protein